jgi:hypothetical protein
VCVCGLDSSRSGHWPGPMSCEHVMNLQVLREVGNSLGSFSRRRCCSELVNRRQEKKPWAQNAVFWEVTPYILVNDYQRFEGTYCLHQPRSMLYFWSAILLCLSIPRAGQRDDIFGKVGDLLKSDENGRGDTNGDQVIIWPNTWRRLGNLSSYWILSNLEIKWCRTFTCKFYYSGMLSY